MVIKGKLMDGADMENTFRRLAFEVLESEGGAENLALVGIRTRGVPTARRVAEEIFKIEGKKVPLGEFDITLYRDDLETLPDEARVLDSVIDFDVTDKNVLLCDDVMSDLFDVPLTVSEHDGWYSLYGAHRG